MRTLVALSLALLTVVACSSEPEIGAQPAETTGAEAPVATVVPQLPPPPPPLPAPVEGTFALPVRIPLTTVGALIDAQLPDHESQPKQAITRSGSSPEIRGSFELWRDPVRVQFEDSTLIVDVPVRYAGKFDARVKNPFGGNWMTVANGEPWGTPQNPQQATLRVRTQVDISPQWTLSMRSTVEPPVHGPPPEGQICTGGGFRLCVSKASVAPTVRSRLDSEVMTRVRKAIGAFERDTVQMLSLRGQVQRVYRDLLEPKPAEHNRWMTLTPSATALSIYVDGDDLVFEPAIAGRLTWHEDKPSVGPPALPDRQPMTTLVGERKDLPEAFLPPELLMLQGN